MAANGCVEEKCCAGELDISAKSRLDVLSVVNQNGVFDHAFTFDQNTTVCMEKAGKDIAQCLTRWNGYKNKVNGGGMQIESTIADLLQGSPASLTLCAETDREESMFHCERRTLRIDRAGSTESVAATSGGESCHSSSTASDTTSEPSSPSRPITPQPMPPVPPHLTDHCPYECLRVDSEDSGLGTSPAKSLIGPASPDGYVSPIQFVPDVENEACDGEEDNNSDSLLDLSPCPASFSPDAGDDFPVFPKFCVTADEDSDKLCEEGISSAKEKDFESGNECDSEFHFCLPATNTVVERDKERIAESHCEVYSTTNSETVLRKDHGSHSSSNFTFEDSRSKDGTDIYASSLIDNTPEKPEVKFTEFLSPPPPKCAKLQENCNINSQTCEFKFQIPLLDDTTKIDEDLVDLQSTSTSVGVSKDSDKTESNLKQSNCSVQKIAHCCEDDEAFRFHHSILSPKIVLVQTDYSLSDTVEHLDCEESRESSCCEPNQGHSNDLCHELTSDCTSSSYSQTNSDVHSNSLYDGVCKWLNCDHVSDGDASSDLIDHIRQCHVQSQGNNNESFVCRWIGCKVYDRPSSSRSWLERHILLHGGSKPFRCIVDGCHQRFSTEGALQRHVNSHFPQSRSAKANDHPPGRICRKKRSKFRRRCLSVKTNDFFDDGIMEHVRHSLFEMSDLTGLDREGPPRTITFHSTVIARRIEATGKVKVLLHWDPEDLLPDCWVSEPDAPSHFEKIIPVSCLPPEKLIRFDPIYAAQQVPQSRKRRRK